LKENVSAMNWNTLTEAVRSRLTSQGETEKSFMAKTEGQRQKLLAGVNKLLGDGASKRTENNEPSRMGLPSAKDLGTFTDIATAMAREAEETEKALRAMNAAGQNFFDGNAAKGIAEVTKALNLKTGQIRLGAEAFFQLNEKVNAFAYLSEEAFNKNGRLSASLAEQAGILKQLGLNYGNFAANTDTAIHSLQLNEEGVKKFNLSIKTLADDLKMLPDEVSRNFQKVSKNLMYDAATIQSQFVKFQVLAQKTGLEADQIAGRFGSGMDTISGASGAAANINALLGRNAFSATELLGMEEADRAEAIRAAIQGDSQLMADIDAGGAQGKFAMISVAESLGMGRDEARRFIKTGEKDDSVKSKLEKEIGSATGVSNIAGDERMSRVISSFTTGTSDLKKALDKLTDTYERGLDPQMSFAVQNRRLLLEKANRGEFAGTEALGTFGRLGSMTKGLSVGQFNQAQRLQPGIGGSLERLVKRSQMGLYDTSSSEFQTMISQLTSTDEKERATGASTLDEITRKSPKRDEDAIRKQGGIGPAAMSVITRVSNMSEYSGRRMMSVFMERFRGKNPTEEQAKAFAEEYKKSDEFAESEKIDYEMTAVNARLKDTTKEGRAASIDDFSSDFGEGSSRFSRLKESARSSFLRESEKKRRKDNESKNNLEGPSGSTQRTTDSSGNTIVNFLLNDTILASAVIKGTHKVLGRTTE